MLTSPSLGMMLVRWTTSRWADCETRESDDREMMWSHIPAKVLHWGWQSEVKIDEEKKGEREKKEEWQKEKDRKLLRLVLVREGCCDLAGGGETEIISSDCSTSPLPSLRHTNCFLSQSVHRHAHKTLSQTEQHITNTSQPRGAPADIF